MLIWTVHAPLYSLEGIWRLSKVEIIEMLMIRYLLSVNYLHNLLLRVHLLNLNVYDEVYYSSFLEYILYEFYLLSIQVILIIHFIGLEYYVIMCFTNNE